jgi:hypothetical protein
MGRHAPEFYHACAAAVRVAKLPRNAHPFTLIPSGSLAYFLRNQNNHCSIYF